MAKKTSKTPAAAAAASEPAAPKASGLKACKDCGGTGLNYQRKPNEQCSACEGTGYDGGRGSDPYKAAVKKQAAKAAA